MNDAPQLPAPVVIESAPLSAQRVHQDRRADLVRRWVIFITVALIGGYCVWIAVNLPD